MKDRNWWVRVWALTCYLDGPRPNHSEQWCFFCFAKEKQGIFKKKNLRKQLMQFYVRSSWRYQWVRVLDREDIYYCNVHKFCCSISSQYKMLPLFNVDKVLQFFLFNSSRIKSKPSSNNNNAVAVSSENT